MTPPFGDLYSGSYDHLYQEKDYAAECDLIEKLFARSAGPVKRVLDLGCGTGNHAIPLRHRGYEVIGVDRSPAMLAKAREKAELTEEGGPGLDFRTGDIRDVDLGQTFDAALMMFAVLGYQTSNEDVLRALKSARRHLVPGGLLIFDIWYGPAVLSEGPSRRTKEIILADGKLTRTATGHLDSLHNLCTVHYAMRFEGQDGSVSEDTEDHTMRYFFQPELVLFLETSGFTDLDLMAFPELDKTPDPTTWNVLGVAQAI